MRLAIVTGTWMRPEIFEMFAAGVKHLQTSTPGIEIICCVAGSEGYLSRTMVERNQNFFYTETPNVPLGRKMNAAAYLAQKLSPNYCLMVGSDDIIGASLMQEYAAAMARGIDYAYLMDCYFFDTRTRHGLYWGGYRKNFNSGKPLGMGRLISAKFLNMINWVCWPEGYDKILDTGFDKQVSRFGAMIKTRAINLKASGLFALDIKSSTNMTPFDLWDNSTYLDGRKLLFDNLPEDLAAKIYGPDKT